MLSSLERAFAVEPLGVIRKQWIQRCLTERANTDGARAWMLNNGFECVDISSGQLLTPDGREVLHAHGKTWALTPEVHAQRLVEAMTDARQRDAAQAARQPAAQPDQPQTACTALIDGQLCGGALTMATVCPRCALGKSGVAATLTCDVCGHVTAVMRGAK